MTINCKGRLIDLSSPKIMGILNLTPDSFYDGGSYKSDKDALLQVEQMLEHGATFIDIGGQSTRPSSTFLTAEEELKRILPVIENILTRFPKALISVDTFYSEVARQAVNRGVAMINDISAGNIDEQMIKTVAELQVPYVMMHMRGLPQNMQSTENTTYENMLQEILLYFSEKLNQARLLGLNDIIIDPGFGFSKTVEHNFELIRNLDLFKSLDLPILMGVSRKSTICKTLGITPKEALNGTSVLNSLSLLNGANIIRVHDIREAWECIQLIEAYNG
ncbi:MAG TPA: dihydropteroate synthase [Flavobacteriaceae bacterium]|nr:dihydropteroate synthase [Flavobacteriaceae bacterium]